MSTTDPRDQRSFDEVFRSLRDVEGWMTEGQARRLWDRAAAVPAGGRIVEIGSYRGRSAIVLASASANGVEVVAIDPHGGNDRGPQEYEGSVSEGEADHQAFLANLRRSGVADRIRHVRRPSQQATPEVPGLVEVVYIDGAHRYRPARDDLRRWGAKVAPGGTLLVHDSFSSVGVTLAEAATMLLSARFRYIGRTGSLAEYRQEDLGPADRAANAFRQLLELPYLARNIAVKLLILARLGRVARLLGSDGTWPY